jgi:hypothetical protein
MCARCYETAQVDVLAEWNEQEPSGAKINIARSYFIEPRCACWKQTSVKFKKSCPRLLIICPRRRHTHFIQIIHPVVTLAAPTHPPSHAPTSPKKSSNHSFTSSRLSICTQCPSVLAFLNLISFAKAPRLPSINPGKLAALGAESMARTGHLICGSSAPA